MPHRQLFSLSHGNAEPEGPRCSDMNPEEVQEAIALLPLREQRVIRSRYFNEKRPSYDAIGQAEGVSGERIRQLEKRAIQRLRPLLQDE